MEQESISSQKRKKSKYELKQIIVKHAKNGIKVDKILKTSQFTISELLLLKLFLAEDAYLSGEKHLADRLVAEVEKTHPKGEEITQILEELKKNKKLYIQKSKAEKKYVFIKRKK